MAVYFLVHVEVNDRTGYERYLAAGAGAPLEAHGGRLLAYDPEPETVEGTGWWGGARAVLVEFETEEGFREWYGSEAYQRAAQHRFEATDSNAILLRSRPVRL